MIKATNEQLITSVFNGLIPFFECKSVDAYTKETTLYDECEMFDDVNVTLWINDVNDFCVSVDNCGDVCTEEQFTDIAAAWHAYERQAGDNTSGI